jgi:methylphosphotriester-DNA--protein-cysteine methyltransferase
MAGRKFSKTHIGITPKVYANIVRFQQTWSKIKIVSRVKNLLDRAFKCGYYDHSHLTNEVKRNTRLAPVNSDFVAFLQGKMKCRF